MTTEHPITPSPEAFSEIFANALKKVGRKIPEDDPGTTGLIAAEVAVQAARWGADQELEACVGWLNSTDVDDSQEAAKDLRAARRPKPPSLKEQALKTVSEMAACMKAGFVPKRSDLDSIRRALEALPDE